MLSITGSHFALVNGTLIDGTGQTPKKDAIVIIKDGVIEEVGDKSTITIPEGVQTADISGKYLMPGLIDAHIHLLGYRGVHTLEKVFESNELQAVRASADAGKVLDFGFTTVRCCGDSSQVLKQAIREGVIKGPRIVSSGKGLIRTGGHPDIPRQRYVVNDDILREQLISAVHADGVDEIRKVVRTIIRSGADMIKVWMTGGYFHERDRYEDVHYTFEEIKTVCEEAAMIDNSIVGVHSKNIRAHKISLDAGVKVIDHFCFCKGEEIDEDLIKKMIELDALFVPTCAVYLMEESEDYEWTKYGIPERTKTAWKKAIEAGVKVAMGSDMSFETEKNKWGAFNITELKHMTNILDLTPMQGIVAATKNAAEACGLGDKTGTLEPGKFADILVVEGNPIENIDVLYKKENILHVIKEGEVVR